MKETKVMSTETEHTDRRAQAGTVVGISTGAIAGGLLGAFALGLPGVGWAIVAGAIGMAMGGYAGGLFGSFFGGD
jgi:hypothetical protein